MSRGPYRAAILVVVAVVLAGGLLAGTASVERVPDPAAALATSSRAPGAATAAWFCAEGTAADDGRADSALTLANVGDDDTRAVVTVYAGADVPPVARAIDLPGRSVQSVRVADVAAVPDPGVVVEAFSPDVVVEHQIGDPDDGDVGTAPCATRASSTWFFAAGTTVRGAQLWLALFNPFGDDAIVDVTFLTDTGVQAPGSLEGLVVPRRTRLAVPVHDLVRRQADVATIVRSRTGRLVAEQSQSFDGTDGRSGVTLTPGAVAPAEQWSFAEAARAPGTTTRLAIANPGSLDTEVEVLAIPDGDVGLEPETVAVGRRSVVVYDLGARIPDDRGFAAVVATTGDEPVVAQVLTFWDGSGGRGPAASSKVGARTGADTWTFASAGIGGPGSVLALSNPGGRDVLVDVETIAAGTSDAPPELQDVLVPAGRRVRLPLGDLLDDDAALVVRGDGPVVAERAAVGDERASVVPGVPSP